MKREIGYDDFIYLQTLNKRDSQQNPMMKRHVKYGGYFIHSLYQLSKKTKLSLQVPTSLVVGFGFDNIFYVETDKSTGLLKFNSDYGIKDAKEIYF